MFTNETLLAPTKTVIDAVSSTPKEQLLEALKGFHGYAMKTVPVENLYTSTDGNLTFTDFLLECNLSVQKDFWNTNEGTEEGGGEYWQRAILNMPELVCVFGYLDEDESLVKELRAPALEYYRKMISREQNG